MKFGVHTTATLRVDEIILVSVTSENSREGDSLGQWSERQQTVTRKAGMTQGC